LKDVFNSTAQQYILAFLANHPSRQYYSKEVKDETGLSIGATNQALRELAGAGFLLREQKGRMSFYSADLSNPLVRQFKVLLNIASLYPLTTRIQDRCIKITLFGSAAQGTNTEDSDIDLFVLANTPNEVLEMVASSKQAEKIQILAKRPVEWAAAKKKESVFSEEVERGIILWEAK
jgi:predicted nucleotidyltransferase